MHHHYFPQGVRQLCAGSRHTVAVTDGGVFAWGEGREGALGLGDTEDRDLPARVNCLAVSHASVGHVSAGTRAGARSSGGGGGAGGGEVVGVVRRVACGSRHTLFLVEGGGVLWCGTMRGVGAGGVGRQEEQEGQRAERLSLVPVKLQGIMEPEGAGGAAPGSSAGHGTGGVAGGGVAAAVPGGGVVVYDVVARGGGSGALACLAGELSAEVGDWVAGLVCASRRWWEGSCFAAELSAEVGGVVLVVLTAFVEMKVKRQYTDMCVQRLVRSGHPDQPALSKRSSLPDCESRKSVKTVVCTLPTAARVLALCCPCHDFAR